MPAPRRRLADIITRHQVFLERFKTGEAHKLAGVFTDLDKRTREVFAALDTPNIGELSKTKLNQLLRDLKAANESALKKGTDTLFETLEKLAPVEAAFEVSSLNSVLKKARVVAAKAEDAYAAALRQPISATGSLLQPFVEEWSAGELKRLQLTVQRAWGEGWPIQKMTQAIRGTKALNYKDGILETSRRNAEAVARTSIQHVASMGRMTTWNRNNDIVLGYVYTATLDGRTTQVCRSLDGRHFKLGEGPVPPVHINCRSTTVADLDPSLDFLDEGATRASMDGPVPADMTYYDWLKTQEPEFIKEAIGVTRAKLFVDGGMSSDQFAALNLGRNFQPLTLDEMQKLNPLAFKRAGIPGPN